jgi:glycosyltransferase involved in cell wall biosynthesis
MHGAGVTLARRAEDEGPFDAFLATDMLDVASFRGLLPASMRTIPIVAYFHENQLVYPALKAETDWTPSRARRATRRDEHYAFINLTTCLAADEVWWNSSFNRDSFLSEVPAFLGRFPDERVMASGLDRPRSALVMPLGLDLASLDVRPALTRGPRPRVVWNHRWEHDKGPDEFFAALDRVDSLGVEFDLIVLGESFGQAPGAFERARIRYGSRVLAWGYQQSRSQYAAWLHSADVVVSTAHQEFFGASVAEAVWCGAQPILPNRLSYPELVPDSARDSVLYDSEDELVAKLAAALTSPSVDLAAMMRRHLAAYDWRSMAPRYDDRLEALTGGTHAPPAPEAAGRAENGRSA